MNQRDGLTQRRQERKGGKETCPFCREEADVRRRRFDELAYSAGDDINWVFKNHYPCGVRVERGALRGQQRRTHKCCEREIAALKAEVERLKGAVGSVSCSLAALLDWVQCYLVPGTDKSLITILCGRLREEMETCQIAWPQKEEEAGQ